MPFVYIPQTVGELNDLLGHMVLSAPSFEDKVGYYPDQSVETEFRSVEEGLAKVRRKIGEERYSKLLAMSVKARALFEADPDETNGKTREGILLLQEMSKVLTGEAH